jgi:hypothetical protein
VKYFLRDIEKGQLSGLDRCGSLLEYCGFWREN